MTDNDLLHHLNVALRERPEQGDLIDLTESKEECTSTQASQSSEGNNTDAIMGLLHLKDGTN